MFHMEIMRCCVAILCVICSTYVMGVIEAPQGQTILIPGDIVTSPPSHGVAMSYGTSHLYVQYTSVAGYEGYDFMSVDGNPVTITVYSVCPTANIYANQYGGYNNIPTPTLSVLDTSFNLSTNYYRENMTYSIDLCQSPSTCGTAIPSVPLSAPTASWLDSKALNNPIYPAYDVGNEYWSLSALNCSSVAFRSNFTFASMLGCRSPGGYCVNITMQTGTPFITYSGSLYVSLRQNGWLVRKWSYPFSYRLNMYATSTATVNMDAQVSMTVTAMMDNYGLLIIISTNTVTTGAWLDEPAYDPSLYLIDVPQNVSSQTWTYRSLSLQNAYSGKYVFSWTLHPSMNLIATTVMVSLAAQIPIAMTYTLGTALFLYKDPSWSIVSNGPYGPTDPIYMATVYQGEFIYDLSLHNVWMCYSNYAGVMPSYDPTQGQWGCMNATSFMPQENIMRLVADGAMVTNDERWNLQGYPGIIVGGQQATGLKIQLTNYISKNQVYYLHVETMLTPKTRIRTRKGAQNGYGVKIANDMHSFYVATNSTPSVDVIVQPQNPVVTAILGTFMSIFMAVTISLVVAIIVSVVRKMVKKSKAIAAQTINEGNDLGVSYWDGLANQINTPHVPPKPIDDAVDWASLAKNMQ